MKNGLYPIIKRDLQERFPKAMKQEAIQSLHDTLAAYKNKLERSAQSPLKCTEDYSWIEELPPYLPRKNKTPLNINKDGFKVLAKNASRFLG